MNSKTYKALCAASKQAQVAASAIANLSEEFKYLSVQFENLKNQYKRDQENERIRRAKISSDSSGNEGDLSKHNDGFDSSFENSHEASGIDKIGDDNLKPDDLIR